MNDKLIAQVLISLAAALGEAVARGVVEVITKARPDLLVEPLPALSGLDRARADALARAAIPHP